MRAAGVVEASRDGATWEPMLGGRLADGVALRTGLAGSATVEVDGGDVLGLGAGTDLRVLAAAPPSFALDGGRLVVEFEPGSTTTVDTPGGTVRAPLAAGRAGSGCSAVVAVADGATSVTVREGDVDVLQRGGGIVVVRRGQTAAMDGTAPGAVVTSAAGGPDDPDARRVPGNPASDPRLKPSPLVAQLWVAVAVIGAGLAGAFGFF